MIDEQPIPIRQLHRFSEKRVPRKRGAPFEAWIFVIIVSVTAGFILGFMLSASIPR